MSKARNVRNVKIAIKEKSRIKVIGYVVFVSLFNPSGSETVDDFIRYTQTNCGNKAEKMEFVSYDRFKDVEFIAEGGFSTVQSAFCIKNSDNINVSLPQSEFQIVVWRST